MPTEPNQNYFYKANSQNLIWTLATQQMCTYWAEQYQPLALKTGPELRKTGSVTGQLKDIGNASSLVCGSPAQDYLTSFRWNFETYQ